jgi:hypothetical protein
MADNSGILEKRETPRMKLLIINSHTSNVLGRNETRLEKGMQ